MASVSDKFQLPPAVRILGHNGYLRVEGKWANTPWISIYVDRPDDKGYALCKYYTDWFGRFSRALTAAEESDQRAKAAAQGKAFSREAAKFSGLGVWFWPSTKDFKGFLCAEGVFNGLKELQESDITGRPLQISKGKLSADGAVVAVAATDVPAGDVFIIDFTATPPEFARLKLGGAVSYIDPKSLPTGLEKDGLTKVDFDAAKAELKKIFQALLIERVLVKNGTSESDAAPRPVKGSMTWAQNKLHTERPAASGATGPLIFQNCFYQAADRDALEDLDVPQDAGGMAMDHRQQLYQLAVPVKEMVTGLYPLADQDRIAKALRARLTAQVSSVTKQTVDMSLATADPNARFKALAALVPKRKIVAGATAEADFREAVQALDLFDDASTRNATVKSVKDQKVLPANVRTKLEEVVAPSVAAEILACGPDPAMLGIPFADPLASALKRVYLGRSTCHDGRNALADAIDVASKEYLVRTVEESSDAVFTVRDQTKEPNTYERKVASTAFTFATNHHLYDFDVVSIDARAKKWMASAGPTIDKAKNRIIHVDAYASSTGEVEWNKLVAKNRLTETVRALKAAGLSGDTWVERFHLAKGDDSAKVAWNSFKVNGTPDSNVLSTGPDGACFEYMPVYADKRFANLRQLGAANNPWKHRTVTVRVTEKVTVKLPPPKKPGEKREVQIVMQETTTVTAMPIARLDLIAYLYYEGMAYVWALIFPGDPNRGIGKT